MLLELGNGNGTAEVLVVPAGPQAAEARKEGGRLGQHGEQV